MEDHFYEDKTEFLLKSLRELQQYCKENEPVQTDNSLSTSIKKADRAWLERILTSRVGPDDAMAISERLNANIVPGLLVLKEISKKISSVLETALFD
jgi:hypothetical protein